MSEKKEICINCRWYLRHHANEFCTLEPTMVDLMFTGERSCMDFTWNEVIAKKMQEEAERSYRQRMADAAATVARSVPSYGTTGYSTTATTTTAAPTSRVDELRRIYMDAVEEGTQTDDGS